MPYIFGFYNQHKNEPNKRWAINNWPALEKWSALEQHCVTSGYKCQVKGCGTKVKRSRADMLICRRSFTELSCSYNNLIWNFFEVDLSCMLLSSGACLSRKWCIFKLGTGNSGVKISIILIENKQNICSCEI